MCNHLLNKAFMINTVNRSREVIKDPCQYAINNVLVIYKIMQQFSDVF